MKGSFVLVVGLLLVGAACAKTITINKLPSALSLRRNTAVHTAADDLSDAVQFLKGVAKGLEVELGDPAKCLLKKILILNFEINFEKT